MNSIILYLLANSRADWLLQPWLGNQSRKMKTLNSNLLLLKIDLVSHPTHAEGLVNTYMTFINNFQGCQTKAVVNELIFQTVRYSYSCSDFNVCH